mgnify:CR=1 FL=1
MKPNTRLPLLVSILLTVVFVFSADAADKPIKAFAAQRGNFESASCLPTPCSTVLAERRSVPVSIEYWDGFQ